jgi:hypothetical protein
MERAIACIDQHLLNRVHDSRLKSAKTCRNNAAIISAELTQLMKLL